MPGPQRGGMGPWGTFTSFRKPGVFAGPHSRDSPAQQALAFPCAVWAGEPSGHSTRGQGHGALPQKMSERSTLVRTATSQEGTNVSEGLSVFSTVSKSEFFLGDSGGLSNHHDIWPDSPHCHQHPLSQKCVIGLSAERYPDN
jgi:hypothetical protein